MTVSTRVCCSIISEIQIRYASVFARQGKLRFFLVHTKLKKSSWNELTFAGLHASQGSLFVMFYFLFANKLLNQIIVKPFLE